MGFYRDHILPRLVNLAMSNAELIPYRKRLLSLAHGQVLEVGVGSGVNLPFYPAAAGRIIGLDPHPKLLAMAAQKESTVPVAPVEGTAESLPFEDGSIDTVILTWTLCSIQDPGRALREMHRVLRPNGQLLFVEHGLAPEENVQRWQHRLTPVWRRIAGGCNLDRPVKTLVEETGFELVSLETGYMKGPKPMVFMYEGRARRL